VTIIQRIHFLKGSLNFTLPIYHQQQNYESAYAKRRGFRTAVCDNKLTTTRRKKTI